MDTDKNMTSGRGVDNRYHLGRSIQSLADNIAFMRFAVWAVIAVGILGILVAIVSLAFPAKLGAFGAAVNENLLELGAFAVRRSALQTYAVIAAVIAIDAFVLGYNKSAIRSLIRPDRTTQTDIYVFLLGAVGLWRYIVMLSFFAVGYFIESKINLHLSKDFVQLAPNIFVQAIIYLLVYDFLDYWRHRIGHRLSWWWEVHLFHHSAEKFNVITVGRSHPVDLALTGLFVAAPMALLGAPVEMYLMFELLRSAQGKLQHSMVDWHWGWIGRHVFISPVAHRIHHSADPIHWDRNFGHIFVFWDKLFGTWYDGDVVNTRVGLRHNPENQHGFIHDLIRAQLMFFAALFSKWNTRTGVLSADEAERESALYRSECAARGVEP